MRVFERGSTIKTREKNLCISCELCVAICPASAIKMIYEGGQFVPQVDTNICNNCGECLDVCPGIDIDLKIDVGSCIESFSAYAKDMDVLLNSTSGGLITQLVIDLLKNDEYKGAFLLNFDMFNGEPARLDLVTGEDDVKKASKSKYLPASVYNVVNTLKSTKNPNYIMVGTPCQIKGIKKYIAKKRIDDKNILFLGLFCDKTLNFNMLNYFEGKFSRENEKLKKFDYRNKENLSSLGNPKLYFNSGREMTVDRSERMKVKDYFQLERCIYCLDKLNRKADISFGDCYIKGKENPHMSNIIVRTEKGKKVWDKYSNLFEFEKTNSASITKSQKISQKKRNLHFVNSLVKGKKSPELKKIQRKIKIGRKKRFRSIKINIFVEKLKTSTVYAVNGFKLGAVIALEYIKNSFRSKKFKKGIRKNIIIFGGELSNKGAQAMTFSVVDQLKLKYPDKEIFLFSKKDYERSEMDKSQYRFRILPCEIGTLCNLIYGKRMIDLHDISSNQTIEKKIKEVIDSAAFCIDISGYSLSSQFSKKSKMKGILVQYKYLMRIMLAKKFSIPFFTLPQSFGPFDYSFFEKILLFPIMKQILKYPKKIYCREKQGLMDLTHFTKDNLEREKDIVLLNDGYNVKNIFNDVKIKKINIPQNSVGIIPNEKVMERTERKRMYDVYKNTIRELLSVGKKVHILRHSQEDLDICIEIKKMFLDNENVVLLIDDLNSIELEQIIKQFDFIIGSRYHSIIHAYKNGIPAIAIGWAIKYEELLKDFKQEKYLFDVRKKLNEKEFYFGLKTLIKNHEIEKDIIISKIRNFNKNIVLMP
jgi:coenzyme F420-reducing hydrogenase beta subunit/polysaccharide pyruvyl transferase WcaK-like protein